MAQRRPKKLPCHRPKQSNHKVERIKQYEMHGSTSKATISQLLTEGKQLNQTASIAQKCALRNVITGQMSE